jgi:hypothetical protein
MYGHTDVKESTQADVILTSRASCTNWTRRWCPGAWGAQAYEHRALCERCCGGWQHSLERSERQHIQHSRQSQRQPQPRPRTVSCQQPRCPGTHRDSRVAGVPLCKKQLVSFHLPPEEKAGQQLLAVFQAAEHQPHRSLITHQRFRSANKARRNHGVFHRCTQQSSLTSPSPARWKRRCAWVVHRRAERLCGGCSRPGLFRSGFAPAITRHGKCVC